MRKVILDNSIQLRCGQNVIQTEIAAYLTNVQHACLVIWETGEKDFLVFETEANFKNYLNRPNPSCIVIWRSDKVRPIKMLREDFGHGRSHRL
jgi:hypothetical protein